MPLTTSMQITAADSVPAVRDRYVTCKYCGASFPRWARKHAVDDPPVSGLRRLAAHEIEMHGERLS
jgi:hypothetical protein